MGNPNFNIWYSAGQLPVTGRRHRLDDVPAGCGDLPGDRRSAVMREVTAEDCDPDRVTPTVSGTSLVPDDVLALMYPKDE